MSWIHFEPECTRKLKAPVAFILTMVTTVNIMELCIAQVLSSNPQSCMAAQGLSTSTSAGTLPYGGPDDSATDRSGRHSHEHAISADPRFVKHIAEAARVRAKLGHAPQDWNRLDPRFA